MITTTDGFMPQTTVSPRSEPHLSPIFNPAIITHTPLPSTLSAAQHKPMLLHELSIIEGVDGDGDEMGSTSDGDGGDACTTSRHPLLPSQPMDQSRQLSAEDRAKSMLSADTISQESAASQVRFSNLPENGRKVLQTNDDDASIVSILQNEVQALSMMNDQLNDALESCERMRKEEMSTAYKQIGRLQSLVQAAQAEKDNFIASNQDAFEQLNMLVIIKKEKDDLVLSLDTLRTKHEELQKHVVELQEQQFDGGKLDCEILSMKASLLAMENDQISRNKDFEERLIAKNSELDTKKKESDKLSADCDHLVRFC
jgi:hypothetical protein